MPWGSEVLGHAIILTSPFAACYGATLLARIAQQLEISGRNLPASQSWIRYKAAARPLLGGVPRKTVCEQQHENAERNELGVGNECVLYDNAAFDCQSLDGSSADVMPDSFEEEELDFCILTPQQALGVLGDHAPQYAKIFLNGSTFVADRSEPGTVLSVDEYADRMHVSSSRHQSLGGTLCAISPVESPAADPYDRETVLPFHAVTDGGAPVVYRVSRSDSSLATTKSCTRTLSSSDRTVSQRNSFDVPRVSFSSSSQKTQDNLHFMAATQPRIERKDCAIEGPYCRTVSQMAYPSRDPLEPLAMASMWRVAAEAAAVAEAKVEAKLEAKVEMGFSHCASPHTPRQVATPSRPALSPQSSEGIASMPRLTEAALRAGLCSSLVAPWELDFGDVVNGQAASSPAAAVGHFPGSGRQPRPVDSTRSASYGGTGSTDKHGRVTMPRRAPAGARSSPTPLPAPVTHSPAGSQSCGSPISRRLTLNDCTGVVGFIWDVDSVPQSPPQPGRTRSCGWAGGSPCSPASCSATPAGLCKAPALPLPEGVTIESAVPPALRYYLEQARAACGQDSSSHGGSESQGVEGRAAGATCSAAASAAGIEVIVAGRRGFVRAAVEQLNTQRLVCCHVTPFAAAKTSRVTRSLGRGSYN